MRAPRTLALLLTLAALLAPAAAAQVPAGSFEGTLRSTSYLLGPEQIAELSGAPLGARPDPESLFGATADRIRAGAALSVETSMSFKGSLVRMGMPDMAQMSGEMGKLMSEGYMLLDLTSNEMTMVVPGLGRAMVMSAEGMAGMLAGVAPDSAALSAPGGAEPSIRELDRETIGGVETLGFEATLGETVTRVWLAPTLIRVNDAMTRLGGAMAAMMGVTSHDVMETGRPPFDRGFPLRTYLLAPVPESQVTQMGRGWSFTWTETSVDPAPLDDAVFQLPEGITIMRAP